MAGATANMAAKMVTITIMGFVALPQVRVHSRYNNQETTGRDITTDNQGHLHQHHQGHSSQACQEYQQGPKAPTHTPQAHQAQQGMRTLQGHLGLQGLLGIIDPQHSQDQQGILDHQDQVSPHSRRDTTRTTSTETNLVKGRLKHMTHNRKNISIQMINVCGLKSKLDIPEFKDALEACDISLLCETKLDQVDEDYILGVITPLKLKAFFKHRKTLSAWRSGGLCILYKENLEKYITYINSSCKLIQWILISKLLIGLDQDLIVGNTYVPPEGTRYQSLTPFQDLQEDIQKFYNCYVCLAGDLNSHTNTNRDYVEVIDFMPEQLNFDIEAQNHINNIKILLSHNIRLSRSNMDQRRHNSHGLQLLEFCKTNNLFISNGRLNSDLCGKATTSEGSLIDYMLANPAILCKVENFMVHDFDAIFSDKHCRVSWSIKCDNLNQNTNNATDVSNVISVKKSHRNMWSSEKTIDFAGQLNLGEIDNIKTKIGNPETHIDRILNDVQIIFKCTADKTLGKEREYEIDTNRKYRPIKFDRQTLNIRNKYCDARKMNTGTDNSKSRVAVTSKAYKKAVSKAKAIARQKVIKKLRNARTSNTKFYWSVLN